MKKYTLLTILLLSSSAILADSIHLTNKTNFPAYFRMATAHDRRYPGTQGPFCVQPGEKVYAAAATYRGISAYVVDNTGKKQDCHITRALQEELQTPWHYDHIVAIAPCTIGCDGKKFEVKKIRRTITRPKMATQECTPLPSPTPRGEAPAAAMTTQKQNLARRLIAQYKELQTLRAKREAGDASPEELARIDQQMAKINKAAIAAGVTGAAVIAGVITGRVIKKTKKGKDAAPEFKFESLYDSPYGKRIKRESATSALKILLEKRIFSHEGDWGSAYQPDIPANVLASYVKIILNDTADPNLPEYGETALHILAKNQNIPDEYSERIATLLLNAGADPALKDNAGRTALFYAVQSGKPKLARLLTEQSMRKGK